jgi:metallo-beta-lactamase class B
MRTSVALVASLALALRAASASAQQESAEVRRYTDRADTLASQGVGMVGDFTWFNNRYCHATDEPGAAAAERGIWQSMVIPPTPVFDNFNYVGHAQYGAWVVETSEGLILIDALNSPDEGRQYIEAGMAKLGLDPADLRYLIVMHGHGDHWGAGRYLQQKYPNLTVALGAEDWRLLENTAPSELRGPPPVRDLVIRGDTTITLGNTTIQLFSTPGHTPGGLSALFTVADGAARHTVAYWGGTGLPGNSASLLQYLQSLRKFREKAVAAGADVLASNHPYLDTTLNAISLLGWRDRGAPHPFVIGRESVQRYYEILDLCVSAALVRQGVQPPPR